MSRFFLFACLMCVSFAICAQKQYSLTNIIEQAKIQSPASRQAETRMENRYWQYRLFKSNYNPQLSLFGGLPDYNRDFFGNRQDNGQIIFQSREQTNSNLGLGLQQPLAFSGGNISVNSFLNQFNDITGDFTQWNTTLVNVRLDQPLFAFNDLKWDKRTEPLRYEESKREYVEELEFISQQSVDRFFDYLDAQVNLEISSFNLANNDTIYNIEQGRYNIGTTSKDKLLQVELQLLRSQQEVAQAQLDLETSRLALITYLGLNPAEAFELLLPESLPEFVPSEAEALTYAKSNRADFLAFERRRMEAQREVARAKADRFSANFSAAFGLNAAGATFDESYNDPNNQQRVNLTLSMPLIDWGRNKASRRTAVANQQLTEFVIRQEEQNFEQEVITQVKQFAVLRIQIEISKKSDDVAQERYLVAQNRYLIGKIDITNLNIALTEKDAARRSYIAALRSFWTSYFELRRLTLYDFVNAELLYTQDEG